MAAVVLEDEPLEERIAFLPVGRANAQQALELVEVGALDGRADLVGAVQVSSEPEEGPESMLRERVRRLVMTQPIDEMLMADRGRRAPGLGDRDLFELDAQDLPQRLHRIDVGLGAPLHVRHVVGARRWLGECRVEGELVAEREREMMMFDRSPVDRKASCPLVMRVESVEVPESEHARAHPERGEIHHGVADMSDLEVDDGFDAPLAMHELPRVPDDDALACRTADGIALQPGERELEARIGSLLPFPVGVFVDLHPETPRVLGPIRARDAGTGKGLDVEAMDPGEDLHVLVHDRIALGVAAAAKMLHTREAIHHVGPGIVTKAPDPGDGNARGMETLLELHLVLEREPMPCVDAIPAHAEREPLAVAIELREPDGPPARLGLDLDDLAADLRLEPTDHLPGLGGRARGSRGARALFGGALGHGWAPAGGAHESRNSARPDQSPRCARDRGSVTRRALRPVSGVPPSVGPGDRDAPEHCFPSTARARLEAGSRKTRKSRNERRIPREPGGLRRGRDAGGGTEPDRPLGLR